jgi:hypothetical protein
MTIDGGGVTAGAFVSEQAIQTLIDFLPELIQIGRARVFLVTVITPLRVIPGHIVLACGYE